MILEKLYCDAELLFQQTKLRGKTKHEAIRAVVDHCHDWMVNIEAERDLYKLELDRYNMAVLEMRQSSELNVQKVLDHIEKAHYKPKSSFRPVRVPGCSCGCHRSNNTCCDCGCA